MKFSVVPLHFGRRSKAPPKISQHRNTDLSIAYTTHLVPPYGTYFLVLSSPTPHMYVSRLSLANSMHLEALDALTSDVGRWRRREEKEGKGGLVCMFGRDDVFRVSLGPNEQPDATPFEVFNIILRHATAAGRHMYLSAIFLRKNAGPAVQLKLISKVPNETSMCSCLRCWRPEHSSFGASPLSVRSCTQLATRLHRRPLLMF
jgi:hypothetical protein